MFLKVEQQLERCQRVVRQRVRPHIHPVLSHCQVRAFDIPGEPIASSEFFNRLQHGDIEFHDFTLGSQWGTTWGTVWFEIRGTVPVQSDNRPVELVLDLGWFDHSAGFHIEGLVYRADGTAVKAVHPRNHWVPLLDASGKPTVPIQADGSFTLYLEAAANPLLLAVIPFIETELGDHATGQPDQPYVFRSADVCAYDKRFEDYCLDLEAVSSIMQELKKTTPQAPRYWQLAKALQRSLNAYDEQHPESVDQARQALAAVLSRPANASAMNVTAVGHAHIDSAWLWPVRETKRKVARTVANVLALMDQYPDFKYAMSSAQQYVWLEQEHPDLFERVRQRVQEGRFIPVGGMWVESDGMLPTGESLIRQISFGQRYFCDRFGVKPRGVWLPDSFGYTGAWPQIARRCGYEWFLTQKISWNDTTKFPHHSFMWEGIDGSRIFTHFPPADTYAAEVTARELTYAEYNFQDKDLSDRSLMLFGYGDGGGGPTREMVERIHRYADVESLSKVTIDTPDNFFTQTYHELVQTAADELPVWHGELYLELHRGTLTSQQAMKRGCRTEEGLLRAIEYLAASAATVDASYVYPTDELDRIWKTLLLNQFHDILPGSSIAWVHREAREEYARDMARLYELGAEASRVLQRAYPSAQVVDQATISQYRTDSSSWVAVPNRNSTGDANEVSLRRNPDGTVNMSNGLLSVVIESDGTVSSLFDEHNKRQLVPAGSRLGRYELLKDEPSVWDAWDIQRDALLRQEDIGEGSITKAELIDGTAQVSVHQQFGHTTIITVISLAQGAAALHFRAKIDWHTRERFLKVSVPLALVSDRAQYDCQYGVVERPIIKNTASDEAKFESCMHRFVRVSQHDYAAAVVNGSLYGCDVSALSGDAGQGRQAGTNVRLSLLSSPVFPDPRTDQGEHSCTWSVLADATAQRTLQEACQLNAPVLSHIPAVTPLVSLQSTEGLPVIDWIKLADDGSGDVIVRLYEAAGDRAQAVLQVSPVLAHAEVEETNLLESSVLPQDLPAALQRGRQQAQGAVVALAPFQIATLRLRPH